MVLAPTALRRVRTILNTSSNDGKKLQILSEKQLQRALDYTNRRNRKKGITPTDTEAAVLIPLCSVGGEPSILFTVRSSSVGTHKNEISFPGGFAEDGDTSVVDTAVREMQEELRGSYDYDHGIQILGEMGSVPSMTGNRVTPVVAALTDDFTGGDVGDATDVRRVFPCPNKDEVELVFTRTIEDLVQSETSEPLERLNSVGPVYPGPEGKIWGLTAIILRPLLHRVIIPAFDGLIAPRSSSSNL